MTWIVCSITHAFEEDTYTDGDQPFVSNLATGISNILSKDPEEIADDGAVVTSKGYNCTIDTFKVHGRTVCRVRFSDIDAFGTGCPYSLSKVSKLLEQNIDDDFGKQPDMKIERWVTAHVLLAMGGQIGGRTDDYWHRARSLAQQLYLNPDLEDKVRQQIEAGDPDKDPAFSKMMDYVEKDCRKKTHNPCHQARRNEYAADNGLLSIGTPAPRIEAPPGCLQMFRGRELRHSITKWTGRRFVCVNVSHEAVRRWALRSLGEEVTETPTSLAPSIMADCIDQEPEDIVPEHQRVLSEREIFPETYESEEELEGSEQGSFEASLPSDGGRKRTSGTKHRADSSSDASAEASDDGESAAKRQKKA